MKKFINISAAIALLAVFSCSMDPLGPEAEGEQGVRPADELVPMILSSGAPTKTSLDGASVNWTDDDLIAVFDNVNYPNKFEAVSTDGSSAVFEGLVGAGTTEFYAVYPYSSAKSIDASNIRVTLPSAQISAAGTFAEEHNISVARGVKTVGEESVDGVSFDNVCGLIHFTVPQRIAAVKTVSFKAENRALAGDLLISKSDLKVTEVSDGSNTVSMSGDFAAGSTFYFVVAPGEIEGFSITVITENGATYSKSSTKSFTVAAAAMKNLGVIDFKAEPSAQAEHIYEDGILTGSRISLNLGMPEGMEEYVEKLNGTIVKKEGDISLEFSRTSFTSPSIVLNDAGIYLPQGDYTVSYTYSLNGVEDSKTLDVNVPAPEFTVSATAYTSYSKYEEGTDAAIAAANGCAAESMYDVTLSAGISEAVLKQLPMTANKGIIYKEDGSEYVSTAGQSLSSPVFYYLAELPDFPWGAYTLNAEVTFDGVTVTSPGQPLHITGLPYHIDFTTAAAYDGWQFVERSEYSDNYSQDYKSGRGYLMYYAYTYDKGCNAFAPVHHAPAAVDVEYEATFYAGTTLHASKSYTLYGGVTTGTAVARTASANITEKTYCGTAGYNAATVTGQTQISDNNRICLSHNADLPDLQASQHYMYLGGLTINYR